MSESLDLRSCCSLGACAGTLQAACMWLWLYANITNSCSLAQDQSELSLGDRCFFFHLSYLFTSTFMWYSTMVAFECNLSFARFLKARKNQKMPYGLTVVSTLGNGFLLLFACGSQVMWVQNHIWLLFSRQSKKILMPFTFVHLCSRIHKALIHLLPQHQHVIFVS